MRKILLSLVAAVLIAATATAGNPTNDTVAMGAGYANDVYYSLANGIVKTETRSNWELAFYTNRWSAGIQINDGAGVLLYTYPLGDISAWNNIDVSGIEGWTPLVNSDTVWEDGAFNRNSLGHPDYGWGVYNSISHDVLGDSIYVVKLANGSLKKLFIERKNSVTNTYYFKYAEIDGTNEVNQVLEVTPYQDNRLFVYYSLMLGMVVDREPDINSWDLVFSRYSAIVFDNTGAPSNYVVVGIACNNEVGVAKHHPVDISFTEWTAKPLEYYRTPIGHDWKTFDMGSFQYLIQDSLVFFIQNRGGDIYKFYPTYFSGSASGKTGFVKELISLVSVKEQPAKQAQLVYPNPGVDNIFINTEAEEGQTVEINLFDLAGKLLLTQQYIQGANAILISVSGLQSGVYMVESKSNGQRNVSRFVVSK